MSGKQASDNAPEDAFLSELYLRMEERAAARYSGRYDAGAASARFQAWLASRTVERGSAETEWEEVRIRVVDVERMNQLPREKVGPAVRYVATLQAQRGDYKGKFIAVRNQDLRSLAIIYDKSTLDLTDDLTSWGVLIHDMDLRALAVTYGKTPASLAEDLASWGVLNDDAEEKTTPVPTVPPLKIAVDLERLKQLPKERVGPLARYVATVQAQRNDHSNTIFLMDREDIRALAVIYDRAPVDLIEDLTSWGLVNGDATRD